MTSRQGCVGSVGRRSPHGLESGFRALRRQAVRKTEGPKIWRQRTRSSESDFRPWKRRKVKRSKECKGFHQGESGLEEEWGVEMDHTEEAESRKKLDEQKKKLQKELRDIEKFSCVLKEFQESLKVKWNKGGTISCQSISKCRKDHKKYKASRTKEEICRKQYRS